MKVKQRRSLSADKLIDTLAPLRKEPPLPEQPALGFFTDTSICIGCKACEVACKQWNQLPATDPEWSGTSYDNTKQLGAGQSHLNLGNSLASHESKQAYQP